MSTSNYQHVCISISTEMICRKKCLPGFYTWRDVLLRGLSAAEEETKTITKTIKIVEVDK